VNLLINLDAGFLQGILFVFLKLSSKSGEIDGKPYAWCFYNSEDSLIYKYNINPETYGDIDLYAKLLKIDNEELNNLLLKHEEHKGVFY
jgi:hypothetical protein